MIPSDKIARLARARAAENARAHGGKSAAVRSGVSLDQLESLFIEKLSEKYRLTERYASYRSMRACDTYVLTIDSFLSSIREIARAFSRFDKDNSGFLDVRELAAAIKVFINGVDDKQVVELVRRYDIDGDGQISLPELTRMLVSRSSADKRDWLNLADLTIATETDSSIDPVREEVIAEVSPVDDTLEDPETVSYQAKLFLSNLRAMLLKRSMDLRLQGKIPLNDRMSQHLKPLAESLARDIVRKAFDPYVRRAIDSFSGAANSVIPPRVDKSRYHK